MNIQKFDKPVAGKPNSAPRTEENKGPESAPKEYQIKDEQYDRADRYEDSREFGNRVAGGLYGAIAETVTAIPGSLGVGYKLISNSRKAETIGPNLKALSFIGGIAAVPATIIAAPFVGLWRGASQTSEAEDDQTSRLTADTSAAFIDNRMSEDKKFQSMTADIIKDLNEFGDKKLGEGEEPKDIPLVRPFTWTLAQVASAAISVTGNLVGGFGIGIVSMFKEAGSAIFGEDKGVGKLAASVLHPVVVPYGMVKEGLKESAPRVFEEAWTQSPMKALGDTLKITAGTIGSAFKGAWNK